MPVFQRTPCAGASESLLRVVNAKENAVFFTQLLQGFEVTVDRLQ